MDAGRHGSRSPRGLSSWLLAAAGTPYSVFRRRDSTPFARPYRPGASRGFPALRPAPVRSPAVFSPPSPLQDRRGTEHSL
ncbi:hypothetical protein NDU88_009961 [Pleurodeles waltl]|uniref:Uncharacterized protein n=1 Tax=Pleurodeles waltl TaxID=8319 RepID=A0AAV7QT33_PLEWA|nr:hypothetical protein NDU88_009961 [Pleurodeles waltl]